MFLRVLIHLGPPKTGTSAIQNWLLSNRSQLLSKAGIFYPEHTVDDNGVSSGNVESVFTRCEDKTLLFSQEKLTSCLTKAEQAGATTLLLSSEFFFKRLEPLFNALPQAIAVAYVRDPLETMESGYNQGVKRHFQTDVFTVPDSPKTSTLDNLDKLITKYGANRFILRPYDKKLFANQDIVSDFIDAIGINTMPVPPPAVINPSYVFETLEFKRWFNQIPNAQLHHLLDKFCQGYRDGQSSFSLLTEEKRERVRQNLKPQLMRFVERHQLHNGSSFLDNLELGDCRAFQQQSISDDTFLTLLNCFLADKNVDKKWLAIVLSECESNIKHQPEFHSLCVNTVGRYLSKSQLKGVFSKQTVKSLLKLLLR